MQGGSLYLPTDTAPIPDALEYKWNENTARPLCHPVGEDFSTYITAAANGGGSLIPDFCKAYISATSRKVFAIPAACGNTTIGQWMYGTQRYFYALRKILAGIEYAKTIDKIEHIYYVWFQGESDAVIGTTENEYIERITEYKNRLRLDCGIEKFCIIKVGYFCAVNKWYERTLNSHEHGKKCDEVIMAAQQKLPSVDSDFVMLTDIAPRLSLLEDYQNHEALGHYNNEGYRLIGEAAGAALAGIAKGK